MIRFTGRPANRVRNGRQKAAALLWPKFVRQCYAVVARRFVRVYWVSWVRAFVETVVVRPQASDFYDFAMRHYLAVRY